MSTATAERRLPNFIEAFSRFAETFNTTDQFARFGGIWMVGTAVNRGVAMRIRGNSLSPNLFIEMIGGPGTGKSQAVNAMRQVFVPATKMSIIPASITRAGLEDYMQTNLQQRKSPDGSLLLSHECIGLSEEMQGILPDQDLGHLTLYNILFDLPSIHKAQTRTHGAINLESPYCSIFTGAQPAFLATAMPEQAWGMGFMSRSILVFDTPRERRSAFELREVDNKLKADLIHDLKAIFSLCGWMEWEKPAIALYDEWWVKHGGLPVPSAKRLAMGYNARRELHMFKLAMIFSLAKRNTLLVTIEDVQDAIKTLLHAEDQMRHIFAEMANTGAMVAVEEAIDLVRVATVDNKPLDESRLIEFLIQRFPSTQVHAMVQNLIDSKAIKHAGGIDARGFRKFVIGDRVASL